MEGKIEGINKTTRVVLIDGNWLKTSDKIKLEWFRQGDLVEYSISDNGTITFIKKIKNTNKPVNKPIYKPKTQMNNDKDKYWDSKLEFDKEKQEVIKREAVLNSAVHLLKDMKISQDLSAPELFELVINFALGFEEFVETNQPVQFWNRYDR